ncbi:nucleolar protein 7-like isoform X1 [Elysia marginata]|uniref:Nucleolar protein 7-like isoform X1 n=1 Tax=Elysia marginata TaxID=1093978 RepID=A0AAV4I4Z4_9GAST|nr:nucleolar protein 7-like isoform X1 [Elysia marginata]
MPRKNLDDLAMDAFDSSSDDDAPEEISVTSSRQERVAQLKSIRKADQEKKEEEKERRRRRNEMFHMQKERKLQELSKRRLPQDVLEGIPAKSSKITAKAEEKSQSNEENNSDVPEEAKDKEAGVKSDESAGEDEGFDEAPSDFIPLGSTNLAVVTENQVSKMRVNSVQKALNFRESRLYNHKLIPRQTTQQRRARAAKKRANRR